MNDKRLKQLFDYQKFEQNSAMNFAIASARSYINSLKNAPTVMELDEDELDMVNAAGVDSGDVRGLLKGRLQSHQKSKEKR